MSDIILEMRQKDAVKVLANGDYVCNLSKEIVIEEGDTVLLKQAFIDTRASQQNTITIPYDINLILTTGFYITDWVNSTSKTDCYKSTDVYGTATGTLNNGQDYVVCQQTNTSIIPNLERVTGWSFYTTKVIKPNNTPIVFQYLNINNTLVSFTKNLFGEEGGQEQTIYFDVICQIGSLKYTSPTQAQLAAIGFRDDGPYGVTNPVEVTLYSPFETTTQITILANNYNTNDLALLISEKLSVANRDPIGTPYTQDMALSNFLFSVQDLPDNNRYINCDNTQLFKILIAPEGTVTELDDFYLGTNQIALSYNETTQKFQFDYLHMPVYSDQGDICCRILPAPTGLGTNQNFMTVAKNSGIFFTALSCVRADDGVTPFDFWEGVLGFDLNSLIAPMSPIISGLSFGQELPTLFQNVTLINGVNCTSGYVGLDATVRKSGTAVPTTTTPISTVRTKFLTNEETKNVGFQSTITNTTAIIAPTSIQFLTDLSSHFLLELKMNLINNVFGINSYGSISGIVSKYYGYGSYTYGQTDGSITYVHKGASVIIKQISVRILNSDKLTDLSVGLDNTIFMQVIKGTPTTPSPS